MQEIAIGEALPKKGFVVQMSANKAQLRAQSSELNAADRCISMNETGRAFLIAQSLYSISHQHIQGQLPDVNDSHSSSTTAA